MYCLLNGVTGDENAKARRAGHRKSHLAIILWPLFPKVYRGGPVTSEGYTEGHILIGTYLLRGLALAVNTSSILYF